MVLCLSHVPEGQSLGDLIDLAWSSDDTALALSTQAMSDSGLMPRSVSQLPLHSVASAHLCHRGLYPEQLLHPVGCKFTFSSEV